MSDGPFTAADFRYDSQDFGEMGEFIRVEYAVNSANARYLKLHPPVSEEMKFTAEDFDGLDVRCGDYECGLKAKAQSAEFAQVKLQRILAQGVRVYGHYTGTENFPKLMWCCSINGHGDTHTGIVINIEEVKDA